jgi:hypothetical protein
MTGIGEWRLTAPHCYPSADALGALILALEIGDIETRATLLRLADFRDLSRSMRRIS